MTDNPYSSPASSHSQESGLNGLRLHEPRRVATARGAAWIAEGYGHFKQDPGNWILICIVGFFVMIALAIVGLIPLVGQLTNLLVFVWIGGLLLGCREQDQGDAIELAHLFAGFKHKFGSLVLLGIIFLTLNILIVFLSFRAVGVNLLTYFGDGGLEKVLEFVAVVQGDMILNFVLPSLIALLFLLPLTMMIWFAPALIVLDNVSIHRAMTLSFKGCLINFMPFLLYGILFLFLYIIALIPLFLGLLILVPTFYGSLYRSYKDIFIEV